MRIWVWNEELEGLPTKAVGMILRREVRLVDCTQVMIERIKPRSTDNQNILRGRRWMLAERQALL